MSNAPPGGDGARPDGGPPDGKRGRKVRVTFRKNITNKARSKDQWTRGFRQHGYETKDHEVGESVRAKGAMSRKRTVIADAPPDPRAPRRAGVIVAVRGLVVDVDSDGPDGPRRCACAVRRVLRSRMISERSPLAVGDRVTLTVAADAPDSSAAGAPTPREGEVTGVIEEVAPRVTVLMRQYGERVQVVAANVDQSIIVSSVDDPPMRPHLIDRFLVAAHKGGLRPLLVINKMDFSLDDDGIAALVDVVERYRKLGYTVLPTSVVSGKGIDALRDVMRGRTSVVVGYSGVGKSSLLNAVAPELGRRIGEVSAWSGRGQHTTTTAELLRLEGGGYVVDTPGIRQFELAHIEPVELEAYFPEFAERVAGCRFTGCHHLAEIGCAIRAAAEAGEIHPERYDSYRRMMTQRIEEAGF